MIDDRKNHLKELTLIVSDTIGIYKEWHIKGDSDILKNDKSKVFSTYIAGCLTSSLDVLKTCHIPGTVCLLKMSPCFAKLSLQSISISFSIDVELFFFFFDPFDPATHPPPPQGKFNFNLEKIQSLRTNSRWPYNYSKPTYIQCQHQFKTNLRIF